MEADIRTLRQLVQQSMYVVDERAVAEAIMLRVLGLRPARTDVQGT
jgi:hypothetical protein